LNLRPPVPNEVEVRVEAKSLITLQSVRFYPTLRKYLIQPNMGHLPGPPAKNYHHADRTRHLPN
jgi:hypothetical protein